MRALFLWLFLLLVPALAACSEQQQTLRWEIIDPDSGKGVEGVWINSLWYGDVTDRGIRPCVGAVLGRTDAHGVFQSTAPKKGWVYAQPAMMFKRDYQPLQFKLHPSDENLVIAEVAVQKHERNAYPAWFERLRSLGYEYVDLGGLSTTTWFKKTYSTERIKDKMNQLPFKPGGRQEYWVKRRTLPEHAAAEGVGAICPKEGAVKIGFDDQRLLDLLDHERAMHAYDYLCDPQWDTVPAGYAQTRSRKFVNQSLWLLPDSNKAYEEAKTVIPDYLSEYRSAGTEDRALRVDERITFCKWLEPQTHQSAEQ
ncbi:MAG: hypothetical protein IPK97_08025 [Ahniella sp.]|nr:hypothetical protein [Ahniella sp.]